MANRRQSRNLVRRISQQVATNWRKRGIDFNFERPLGDYIVEHYNAPPHRAGAQCGICEGLAKKANNEPHWQSMKLS